jgi:hypothetical protein
VTAGQRDADSEPEDPGAARERARRRAQVFGDVLPESTQDDRPASSEDGGEGRGERGDEWLRANVPPHHGS